MAETEGPAIICSPPQMKQICEVLDDAVVSAKLAADGIMEEIKKLQPARAYEVDREIGDLVRAYFREQDSSEREAIMRKLEYLADQDPKVYGELKD